MVSPSAAQREADSEVSGAGNKRKLRVTASPSMTLTMQHVPQHCRRARTVLLGPLTPQDLDAASFINFKQGGRPLQLGISADCQAVCIKQEEWCCGQLLLGSWSFHGGSWQSACPCVPQNCCRLLFGHHAALVSQTGGIPMHCRAMVPVQAHVGLLLP